MHEAMPEQLQIFLKFNTSRLCLAVHYYQVECIGLPKLSFYDLPTASQALRLAPPLLEIRSRTAICHICCVKFVAVLKD